MIEEIDDYSSLEAWERVWIYSLQNEDEFYDDEEYSEELEEND